MNALIYDPISPRRPNRIIGYLVACLALATISLSVRFAAAAPEEDVRATFERFAALYEGTWRLEPEVPALRVTMLGDRAAQIYVPILFTIGAAGQPAQPTRFLMNMVVVTTPAGWRVSSILPIPAPAQ